LSTDTKPISTKGLELRQGVKLDEETIIKNMPFLNEVSEPIRKIIIMNKLT
jgi:hypothetical protein